MTTGVSKFIQHPRWLPTFGFPMKTASPTKSVKYREQQTWALQQKKLVTHTIRSDFGMYKIDTKYCATVAVGFSNGLSATSQQIKCTDFRHILVICAVINKTVLFVKIIFSTYLSVGFIYITVKKKKLSESRFESRS